MRSIKAYILVCAIGVLMFALSQPARANVSGGSNKEEPIDRPYEYQQEKKQEPLHYDERKYKEEDVETLEETLEETLDLQIQIVTEKKEPILRKMRQQIEANILFLEQEITTSLEHVKRSMEQKHQEVVHRITDQYTRSEKRLIIMSRHGTVSDVDSSKIHQTEDKGHTRRQEGFRVGKTITTKVLFAMEKMKRYIVRVETLF